MKTIIAIILGLSLSGCFYQTVDAYDLNKAVTLCGSIENVSSISADALGGEYFQCFDGKTSNGKEVRGKSK